jgi:hypothetical protein
MVATEPCPVCGSVDAHPVVSRRGFSYVRCSHCRAVYVSPMPLAEEVARIYQDLCNYLPPSVALIVRRGGHPRMSHEYTNDGTIRAFVKHSWTARPAQQNQGR